MTTADRAEVQLSLQRALLGRVAPQLWGVGFSCDESRVVIRYFFDDPESQANKENAAEATTEVIADLPGGVTVSERIDNGPAAEDAVDIWVYRRAS